MAACNASGGDATTSSVSTTADASIWDQSRPGTDVVLELEWQGGLRDVSDFLTRIPYFAAYADGSVLTGGDTGSKLQPLVRIQLTGDQMADLNELVHEMNLTRIDEVMVDSKPGLFDFSTTVATFTDASGEPHTFGVYAVMQGSDEYDQQEQALGQMLSRYRSLGAEGGEAYVPDRIQLFLSLGGSDDLIEWPLGVTPGQFSFGGPSDTRCLVVTDAAAITTAGVLGAIDQGVAFEHEGKRYNVLGRVLLPHEKDVCGREVGNP